MCVHMCVYLAYYSMTIDLQPKRLKWYEVCLGGTLQIINTKDKSNYRRVYISSELGSKSSEQNFI